MLTKFTIPLIAGSLLLSSSATALTKKKDYFEMIYPWAGTKGSKLDAPLNDTSVTAIRLTVPDKNRIRANKPLHSYADTQFTQQGDTYLLISWPITYYNTSNTGAGRKLSSGALGITAGVEHYYKDRRALGIDAGAARSIENGAVDSTFGGDKFFTSETVSAVYFDLYHKHTINRFSFAYGINYTFNTWRVKYSSYYKEINPDALMPYNAYDKKLSNHSLGIALSGYYSIKSFFHAGMSYRPTLLRISPDTKGIYQHTLTIDMLFTIKVKSRKQ